MVSTNLLQTSVKKAVNIVSAVQLPKSVEQTWRENWAALPLSKHVK